MLQLHLNDRQFYCILWCALYQRFYGSKTWLFVTHEHSSMCGRVDNHSQTRFSSLIFITRIGNRNKTNSSTISLCTSQIRPHWIIRKCTNASPIKKEINKMIIAIITRTVHIHSNSEVNKDWSIERLFKLCESTGFEWLEWLEILASIMVKLYATVFGITCPIWYS